MEIAKRHSATRRGSFLWVITRSSLRPASRGSACATQVAGVTSDGELDHPGLATADRPRPRFLREGDRARNAVRNCVYRSGSCHRPPEILVAVRPEDG